MRVISRKTLQNFWAKHADAEPVLRAWFHEAKSTHWNSFTAIKARYRSADVLPGNRVVFNLKGNTYRLIVHIHYKTGIVFIRFIGTHPITTRSTPRPSDPSHETQSSQNHP